MLLVSMKIGLLSRTSCFLVLLFYSVLEFNLILVIDLDFAFAVRGSFGSQADTSFFYGFLSPEAYKSLVWAKKSSISFITFGFTFFFYSSSSSFLETTTIWRFSPRDLFQLWDVFFLLVFFLLLGFFFSSFSSFSKKSSSEDDDSQEMCLFGRSN